MAGSALQQASAWSSAGAMLVGSGMSRDRGTCGCRVGRVGWQSMESFRACQMEAPLRQTRATC
eukprot:1387292-Alexandrium_andersonii.AAC.1